SKKGQTGELRQHATRRAGAFGLHLRSPEAGLVDRVPPAGGGAAGARARGLRAALVSPYEPGGRSGSSKRVAGAGEALVEVRAARTRGLPPRQDRASRQG